MPKELLDEREFELINILGKGLGASQRELSSQMNLSLGMVNMLLRRMITKGYIRIEQLNQKKVQYLLTPKGFAEKMRKSVKYTVNTIHSISLIREHLKKIVLPLSQEEKTDFFILGDSDLTVLLEIAFKEHFNRPYKLKRIKDVIEFNADDGYLLICKEGYENGKSPKVNAINVLEEIAKTGMFRFKEL